MAEVNEEKKCSKCGTVFNCHVEGGCWCNNYSLSPETLAKLKSNFANCLCESCLKTYQQEA